MQENVNDGHSWTLGSRLAVVYFPLMSEFFLHQWVEKQSHCSSSYTPSGQDPDAWCDLSKFDLPEEPSADGSFGNSPVPPQPPQPQQPPPHRQLVTPVPSVTEYRLDGHTISDLSRSSRGELIPISPSTEVGGFGISTPPSVLKRQKKRRVALSPVTEKNASLSFLDSCNSLTPKSTPVKTLPFSPSQVCGPHPGCSLGLVCGLPVPSTGAWCTGMCHSASVR